MFKGNADGDNLQVSLLLLRYPNLCQLDKNEPAHMVPSKLGSFDPIFPNIWIKWNAVEVDTLHPETSCSCALCANK